MKKVIVNSLLLVLLLLTACGQQAHVQPTHNEGDIPMRPTQLSAEDFDTGRRLDPESILCVDGGVIYVVPASSDSDFQFTLYFMDEESNKMIPVCAQPNCTHNRESSLCSANMEGLDAWRGMCYIDGWLYVTGQGTGEYSNQFCLWKIALDGSSRDIVLSFGRMAANDSLPSGDWMIHRGYVYYTKADDEKTISVYRQSLQKKDEEKLYSVSGIGSQLIRLCGVDDGFYFETCYYTDESLNHFKGGLYYYDLNTNEAKLILDNCCKPYAIGYDEIYYMTADSVYAYNPSNNASRKITQLGDFGYLTYDGEYLYCETEKSFIILTPDGNNRIDFPCSNEDGILQNVYCCTSNLLSIGANKGQDGNYQLCLFRLNKDDLINHPQWDVMPLKDMNNK